MDFLNEELKRMLKSEKNVYEILQIKPDEIDDIQLMRETKLSFFDEDEQENLQLIYYAEKKIIELKKIEP
jgi:DNA-directed RNA polymerase subunit F